MKITFLKNKNLYVDSAGRQATVTEYGKDFYNCIHDFKDTGARGETMGANGKYVGAVAHQCTKCFVFTVLETKK